MARTDLTIKRTNKETNVHVLPCKIHYTGECKVSEYFDVDEENKTVHFRGRFLQGRELTLPEKYKGYVLEETTPNIDSHSDEDDDNEQQPMTRNVETIEQFNKINVWGHEQRVPCNSDPWLALADWVQVASTLHCDGA